MDRAYNVIDSDGHVLEPLDLWVNYIDPAFRDRAPRLFIDEDGKQRLRIDGKKFVGAGVLARSARSVPATASCATTR